MTHNTYTPTWFRLFMPLQTEEMTQREVAFLARLLPLPRYARILDLGCGYGRHTLGLAARGYRVTALDRDPAAIAEATRRAEAAQVEVACVVGDMREIASLPGEFDAIISMWQSLGYFDEATNAEILRQMREKLTPGGRVVVDIFNRAYFERNAGEKRQTIDGVEVESRGYMEDGRWHSVLTYRDADGVLGEDHFDWQLFTPDEFIALAARYDFTPRMVCSWADETIPASPEQARMQITLERA